MRGLADFLGDYAVARRIEDARAQASGQFEGRARIAARPGGALYHEHGHLTFGAQTFAAERRYLWAQDGARIAVAFEDARPFHSFDPVLGGQAEEHLCGADLYRGGYDLGDWPVWRLIWEVEGPRKSYRSVTDYRPLR